MERRVESLGVCCYINYKLANHFGCTPPGTLFDFTCNLIRFFELVGFTYPQT